MTDHGAQNIRIFEEFSSYNKLKDEYQEVLNTTVETIKKELRGGGDSG